jgi:hypothetical protein
MRVAIYGTGGAGGYFGAQLARAGEDVTFVARGPHLKAIQAQGLCVETLGLPMAWAWSTSNFIWCLGRNGLSATSLIRALFSACWSSIVAHCQDRPAKHSASITRAGPQMRCSTAFLPSADH